MTYPTKVLLTGSTGLLGRAVLATAPGSYKVFPVFSKNPPLNLGYKFLQTDITKKNEVNAIFEKVKPDVVIHAASIGNVDYCERNQEEAFKVNVTGTENLVKLCQKIGSRLVFISSNAVFDGFHPPYSETSQVAPVNCYGQTKVAAEKIVSQSGLDFLIIRFTLMYGWNNSNQRSNAVTWLLDKLRRGEDVNLVTDTYVNPVFNLQAAECLWKALFLGKTGIYHVGGGERVNRYLLGLKTAQVFGFETSFIKPVTSDFFPGIAQRMPDTTFDTSQMQRELKIRPLKILTGLKIMRHISI